MRVGDVKEGSRWAGTKQEVGGRVVRDDVEKEEEQKPENGKAWTRMSRASLSSRVDLGLARTGESVDVAA